MKRKAIRDSCQHMRHEGNKYFKAATVLSLKQQL
jgi:hypothetical protein